MTIATTFLPVNFDNSISLVATHTVFGFSTDSWTFVKAHNGKESAQLSTLISSFSSPTFWIITLRFLAIPPMYFNFLFSSSCKKLVLFPYPASISTIAGWYPLAKLWSIKSMAISGFFLNSGSAFPLGNESAFWYNSISKGKLLMPSYRWLVTATTPFSVFPISPIYCRPTTSVKLPLFRCPQSSTIRLKPRLILVWRHWFITSRRRWFSSIADSRCCR